MVPRNLHGKIPTYGGKTPYSLIFILIKPHGCSKTQFGYMISPKASGGY